MSVGQSKGIRARQGRMERWNRRTKKIVAELKERQEQRLQALRSASTIQKTKSSQKHEPKNEVEPITMIFCAGGQTKHEGPCDMSGWVDIVEPTTGRVTGGSAICTKCGMMALNNSIWD